MDGLKGAINKTMFGKKKKATKKPMPKMLPKAPLAGMMPAAPAGIAVGKQLKI